MGKFSKMHCARNPFKKMDAMYNGKPGIQKEDFKQFSDSPMSFDTLRQAKKAAKKLQKQRFKAGEITRKDFKKSKKAIRGVKDIDAGGVPFHESYEPPVKNK
tara:strand:- start:229 stop:534 length:306 start_codon:yes stop_codon:yes gene_type:complete